MVIVVDFLLLVDHFYLRLTLWTMSNISYIRGRSRCRRFAKSSGIVGEIRRLPSRVNTGLADLVGTRRLSTSASPVGNIFSMGDTNSRFGVDIMCWRWGVGVVSWQCGKSRFGWCRYGDVVVRLWIYLEFESFRFPECNECSDTRCRDERDALLTQVERWLLAERRKLGRLCVEWVAPILAGNGWAESATFSKDIISPCSMRVYEVNPDSNSEISASGCSVCLDCALAFPVVDSLDWSSWDDDGGLRITFFRKPSFVHKTDHMRANRPRIRWSDRGINPLNDLRSRRRVRKRSGNQEAMAMQNWGLPQSTGRGWRWEQVVSKAIAERWARVQISVFSVVPK